MSILLHRLNSADDPWFRMLQLKMFQLYKCNSVINWGASGFILLWLRIFLFHNGFIRALSSLLTYNIFNLRYFWLMIGTLECNPIISKSRSICIWKIWNVFLRYKLQHSCDTESKTHQKKHKIWGPQKIFASGKIFHGPFQIPLVSSYHFIFWTANVSCRWIFLSIHNTLLHLFFTYLTPCIQVRYILFDYLWCIWQYPTSSKYQINTIDYLLNHKASSELTPIYLSLQFLS